MHLKRRTLLKALPFALGACAVASQATFTTSDFERTETTLRMTNLPDSFEGYRIAFLSDLHCGVTFPLEWVHRTLELAHSSRADILLLGGDYLWIPTSWKAKSIPLIREEKFAGLPEKEMIDSIFREVARALTDYSFPDGICAVFGNHDRWENPQQCLTHFGHAGVHFLVNSSHITYRDGDSLLIYGADDYWTGFPAFPADPHSLRKHNVSILLAHNPDFVDRAFDSPAAQFDFALAGHTHGGQIIPVGNMPLITNIQNDHLRSGLYTGARFPVYTTRGVGVVEIPYRVNCRPEVSILTLHSA